MNKRIIDLTGRRFGKLVVLSYTEVKKGQPHWLCKCDCGTIKEFNGHTLKQGGAISCGCRAKEPRKSWFKQKHGMYGTRIYRIYRGIVNRCTNPNDVIYQRYGARGITLCDEWLGECGFINFKDWAFENGYSDELTIDRIDVNGNYEPSNCRWATMQVQENNKRSNHYITYQGEKMTIADLSRKLNISWTKAYRMVKANKLIEREDL